MMRFFTTFCLVLIAFVSWNQDKFLKMNGKVYNIETNKKLKQIEIGIITSQGVKFTVPYTNGKYKFYLKPYEEYNISVSAKGYKTKSFQINATNIERYYTSKKYTSRVDVELEPLTDANKDKFQPKIGVLKFNKEVEGFEWDVEFSESEKFRQQMEYGDSTLLNKSPELPNAMSQFMIFNLDSIQPNEISGAKAGLSQVFSQVNAGQYVAQALFWANKNDESKACKEWNKANKLSGNRLMNSANLVELMQANNQYPSTTDTLIFVRLGEWLETSNIMMQTSKKFNQKSYYLAHLETFLVRMDTNHLRDHELSFIADLENLMVVIKSFKKACNLVVSNPENEKKMQELNDSIGQKLKQIVSNLN